MSASPSQPPEPGPLGRALDALRALVHAWYPGRRAVRLRVDLDDGEALQLPLPAGGEGEPCRHSPDFRSLCWHGAAYQFSATQAAVVKVLWDAWASGVPEVGQAALLEAADSGADRLRDLFRGHDAWGELIAPGRPRGTYRLHEPA